MTTNQLTDVPGIGAAAAALLRDAGFHTASDLANASAEALSRVKGFGPARARRTIEAAKSTVNALPEASNDRQETEEKPATATPPAADQQPKTAKRPTASAAAPGAQPTAGIQPAAAKGGMIGRLVGEPWYLIGLAIVVMVGAGLAQESGLKETLGLGSGQPEAQAGMTAQAAAPQPVTPTVPAGEAASDDDENAVVAATPANTETQPVSPDPAVPAVYRPFAYPYGTAAEATPGDSEGGAGGSFVNPPLAPGYGYPYPHYGYAPYALPYPVPGPYRAGLPGYGRY